MLLQTTVDFLVPISHVKSSRKCYRNNHVLDRPEEVRGNVEHYSSICYLQASISFSTHITCQSHMKVM